MPKNTNPNFLDELNHELGDFLSDFGTEELDMLQSSVKAISDKHPEMKKIETLLQCIEFVQIHTEE